MKQTTVTITINPDHVGALLAAVSATGIAAGLTINGTDDVRQVETSIRPSRRTTADDDDDERGTVAVSRRARKAQPTRISYTATVTRREADRLDLSPARAKVLADVIAAGRGGVVDGFAGIAKRTRLNPKTVDGSIYWLRHHTATGKETTRNNGIIVTADRD
jgi:hypothetical protein